MRSYTNEILETRPYGFIEYDNSIPALILHFESFMDSEQFKDFMIAGLHYFNVKSNFQDGIVWISDTRNHSVIPNNTARWVCEEWNVLAYDLGVREVIFLKPKKYFARASVYHYLMYNNKRATKRMKTKIFDHLDEYISTELMEK